VPKLVNKLRKSPSSYEKAGAFYEAVEGGVEPPPSIELLGAGPGLLSAAGAFTEPFSLHRNEGRSNNDEYIRHSKVESFIESQDFRIYEKADEALG
jgi:hypothetical protein